MDIELYGHACVCACITRQYYAQNTPTRSCHGHIFEMRDCIHAFNLGSIVKLCTSISKWYNLHHREKVFTYKSILQQSHEINRIILLNLNNTDTCETPSL